MCRVRDYITFPRCWRPAITYYYTWSWVWLFFLQEVEAKALRVPLPVHARRRRRYAYEDTHEWPADGSMDYDFEEEDEEKEGNLWEEVARNWQVVGVRLIFVLCGVCMLFMLLFCCCNVCCRVCCHSLRENCVPCGGALEYITSCYEDPNYKRAKNLAEMMGLKLDYATYMKIRDSHDLEAGGGFNPMGM
ncbi:uncharacterized protein LOC106012835 [Aplysia californica]|uniref:Uncharacterized protein LOC106012835 n=1 Tax=Aplysia californica TaxID=6500 RepID=A0ABM1A7M4_APLCA|nr:uncharacterized protein LOC106012835 [Aplysia californica]